MLHTLQGELAKNAIQKTIAALEEQIKNLEAQITECFQKQPEFFSMVTILTSFKGIGKLSAYRILAYLPDISLFDNAKQLAAFIGLSPKQKESGKYKGKTCLSKFGSANLRNAFYMPALSAKRHNEHLAPFVTRLQKNGLKPKAIVGAIMRKMAHLIFGMIKSMQPFNPALLV